jgi:hypothetical protein
MTGFLDLPHELRYIVYNSVLEMIIAENDRIFWGPKISGIQVTIEITRRKGTSLRQSGGALFYDSYWCPPVNLRDITSFVLLAQSCKFLHDEVLKFAWSNADITIQSTLRGLCHELRSRPTFSMTPLVRSCIGSLELIICNLYEKEDQQAMKEIVNLINTHLLALKRLNLSWPNVTLSFLNNRPTSDLPAKAVFAQLHLLRLGISAVFRVYRYRSGLLRHSYRTNGRYRTCDELAALLTDLHASHRTTALNRHRKKQNRELFDLDYYLLETAGLRSISHNEEISRSPIV